MSTVLTSIRGGHLPPHPLRNSPGHTPHVGMFWSAGVHLTCTLHKHVPLTQLSPPHTLIFSRLFIITTLCWSHFMFVISSRGSPEPTCQCKTVLSIHITRRCYSIHSLHLIFWVWMEMSTDVWVVVHVSGDPYHYHFTPTHPMNFLPAHPS